MRSAGHGWPKNPSETSISSTVQLTRPFSWTRPSLDASPTKCPKSRASDGRSPGGGQRSSTITTPAHRTDPPRGSSGHQKGETSRPRIPKVRQLPAPLPPPRRRRHLAQPAHATPHPDPAIPTQMRRAAKESVRDIYLVDGPADAALLVDKAIAGCVTDEVPEIQSLGRTLSRWRTEILNHHHTGASNGPTEGLNLVIKKVKRAGHGFRRFDNYRLRCLLHAGGVTWPNRPTPPRIRTRQSPLR